MRDWVFLQSLNSSAFSLQLTKCLARCSSLNSFCYSRYFLCISDLSLASSSEETKGFNLKVTLVTDCDARLPISWFLVGWATTTSTRAKSFLISLILRLTSISFSTSLLTEEGLAGL